MKVHLTRCQVPWAISPTTGAVTLVHSETDASPECAVIFGAGRLRDDDLTDDRVVELKFDSAWHARAVPHRDNEDVDAAGFELDAIPGEDRSSPSQWVAWHARHWRETGTAPHPFFYFAKSSPWLEAGRRWYSREPRHYVVWGRDGHVEVLAESYSWREWIWPSGHRAAVVATPPTFESGERVE